ncbi:MAG TPA: sigma factor, partial [Pirellulales bacterium]|nr:sigma factor [Pirellulales bacterium]
MTPNATHRQWVLGLVEQYEAPLVRYARRLTGELESARDVVQHALLRLCDQSSDSLDDPRAWLYTVCHHRALDVRRQAIRVISLVEATSTNDGDEAIASRR